MGGKDIQMNLYTPYGLDTEAKQSTGFRMQPNPKKKKKNAEYTNIKSQRRSLIIL